MGDEEKLDNSLFEQLEEALEEREGRDRRKQNVGVDETVGQDRRKNDRRQQQES